MGWASRWHRKTLMGRMKRPLCVIKFHRFASAWHEFGAKLFELLLACGSEGFHCALGIIKALYKSGRFGFLFGGAIGEQHGKADDGGVRLGVIAQAAPIESQATEKPGHVTRPRQTTAEPDRAQTPASTEPEE